jgi:hypothetical protein
MLARWSPIHRQLTILASLIESAVDRLGARTLARLVADRQRNECVPE